MPGRNGTGPTGQGPFTGRKMGLCQEDQEKNAIDKGRETVPGRGQGQDQGRGQGRGQRRGQGRGIGEGQGEVTE